VAVVQLAKEAQLALAVASTANNDVVTALRVDTLLQWIKSTSGNDVTVISGAGAGGIGSAMLYVGLTSADVCAIVGVNSTANQAYWLPSGSSQAWPSAACCLP
jgi:hypothetical protein